MNETLPAIADVNTRKTYVIAPMAAAYPLAKNVGVLPTHELMSSIPEAG
ncbi:MAG TPA: hypothetical protein VEP67_05190 [Thiobacillaceae bacterium]|nr:hypothetical protein [Thiobacillaceae bacterium]